MEVHLLDLMRLRGGYTPRGSREELDTHSMMVYDAAKVHLEKIIKYGGSRESHLSTFEEPQEGELSDERLMGWSNSEFFEAWVLFGCPGVSLPQVQRVLRQCESVPRTIKPYPKRPAYDYFSDPHIDRQVILSLLDEIGPARLRDFILQDSQSGLPARQHFIDIYSERMLAIALAHLDALANLSSGEEAHTLPYARHFDAWMVGRCPGLRTWNLGFNKSSAISEQPHSTTMPS